MARSRATTAREAIGCLRRRERRSFPVSRLLHEASPPRSGRPSVPVVGKDRTREGGSRVPVAVRVVESRPTWKVWCDSWEWLLQDHSEALLFATSATRGYKF